MDKQAILGGPITFVTIVKNSNSVDEEEIVIIYAHGPWVFTCPLVGTTTDNDKNTRLFYRYKCSPFISMNSNNDDVFRKGSIVHGMKQSFVAKNTRNTSSLWVVYGNRKLSLLSGGITSDWVQYSISNGGSSSSTAAPYMVVSDWIWDARALLQNQQQQQQQQSNNYYYQVAIALATNMVEIWSLTSNHDEYKEQQQFHATLLFRVGEIKCMTYCMSFYGWYEGENALHFPCTHQIYNNDSSSSSSSLLIASGTCFSEIILWQLSLNHNNNNNASQQHNMANNNNNNNARLLQRMQGHHGAVYSIKWHHDTTNNTWYLASTSDDRTVRLWKLVNDDNNKSISFQQQWCGYGHSSRVWDVIVLPNFTTTTRKTVASIGEEGIVRIWKIDPDKKTAATSTSTFRGHYDGLKMCLWKIATITIHTTSYIAVGGNDGCIKLYPLLDDNNLHSTTTKVVLRVPSSLAANDGNDVDDDYCSNCVVQSSYTNSANWENMDSHNHMGLRTCSSTNMRQQLQQDNKVVFMNTKNPEQQKVVTNNNEETKMKLVDILEQTMERKNDSGNNNNHVGTATTTSTAILNDDKETEATTMLNITKNKKTTSKVFVESICSAQFYPTDRTCILVSMKSGALWTFHLMNSSSSSATNDGYWRCHLPWWSTTTTSTTTTSFPHEASCMSIHPFNGSIVAFGSTKSDIALVSLTTTNQQKQIQPIVVVVIKALNFFTIHALHWITKNTLIVFHIKGLVSLWKLLEDEQDLCNNNSNFSLSLSHVLDMKTNNSVPTSFAFEKQSQLLFVGDTRGNIAMFDTSTSTAIHEEQQQQINMYCNSTSEISSTTITVVELVLHNNHQEALLLGKIPNAHGKEHVTALAVSSVNGEHVRLLSVGLDGYLTESNVTLDNASYRIEKAFSRPISSLSSLSHVWVLVDGRVVVGGFQGVAFSLWDTTNGFELLSEKTGGRQRRHIVFLDTEYSTTTVLQYSLLAICASSSAAAEGGLQQKKNCSHEIHAYFLSSGDHSTGTNCTNTSSTRSLETFKNLSIPLHGETVNDVCWVATTNPERILLLSGSKDGTVNLCLYKSGSFVAPTIKLPPHESSVKAVCCSRHAGGGTTSLLVTAGGKLLMNFYRLEELKTAFVGCQPYSLHFLCCHKPKVKAPIDHRINAVKALPILQQNGSKSLLHLVFAGDSNGCLHLFVVDELNCCRTISSQLICADNRPILCLDVVYGGPHGVFAFIGNSTGEVYVWHIVYRDLANIESKPELKSRHLHHAMSPAELVWNYKAHQMGTNSVSALIEVKSDSKSTIIICSGGDDQALVVCVLEVTLPTEEASTSSSGKAVVVSIVKDCQNESCLRSVKIRAGRNCYFLYAVGYEQRLTIWSFSVMSENGKTGILERLSQTGLDVFDIASMDCIENCESFKSPSRVFAVSGEGVETLSLNLTIFEASLALLKADYLLISAGAGFSADSGLMTYECMPELYREFCKPFALLQKENEFQKFWLEAAKTYESALPHEGYHILESWCCGDLPGLARHSVEASPNIDSSSPWWVYTSNVDGHFRRFRSFQQRTCEIHGFCNEFRCSSAMGLENGAERQGAMWMQWNAKATAKSLKTCASDVTIAFSENESGSFSRSEASSHVTLNHLQCMHCGLPLRPNVLMFHDTDENVLCSIRKQRDRYQTWEQKMEDDVVLNGKKLVILELGCGLHAPAVRQETEEVLRDCISRMTYGNVNKKIGRAGVTLIRVNPKDAELDSTDRVLRDHTLSVYDTSLNALHLINLCVKSMKGT